MGIRTELRTEILDEIKELKKMELGSEQHNKAVDSVTKLVDKINDIDRVDHELQTKTEFEEQEFRLKVQQLELDKRDKIIKNCLTGVSIVGSFAIAVWGTIASINFEKEGTITTSAGRKHLNKILSMFK